MPRTQQTTVLPLNDILPLSRTLAVKETHRPDDVDDLVQVGLFAYHKAEQRYRKLRIPVKNPWAFARTTLQRAMRSYYYQQREWQQRGEPNKAIGLDKVALTREDEMIAARHPMLLADLHGRQLEGEQVEMFELADFFAALQQRCGVTARLMVENLIAPTGDCSACILQEVQDKHRAQKAFQHKARRLRRHQPRGVKHKVRVSPRMVRDALGLSPTHWTREMAGIRNFTREWFGRAS